MKIEKINDNQIRCTLTRDDLNNRQLKLSELAYGTEKAKELFREMMQQAAIEFGFEADNIPLMIEAIPISEDSLMITVTKVSGAGEMGMLFGSNIPDGRPAEETTGPSDKGVTAGVKETSLPEQPVIYVFDTFDLLCRAAQHILHGRNALCVKGVKAAGLHAHRRHNPLQRVKDTHTELPVSLRCGPERAAVFRGTRLLDCSRQIQHRRTDCHHGRILQPPDSFL